MCPEQGCKRDGNRGEQNIEKCSGFCSSGVGEPSSWKEAEGGPPLTFMGGFDGVSDSMTGRAGWELNTLDQ